MREPVEQPNRLRVELLKLGLLDLVLAFDLLDDELGVEEDLDPIRLPLPDGLEPLDQGVVLGLVVGHRPQPLRLGVEAHALLVLDQDAGRGRTRVAARCSVGPQAQNFQAITRIRPQFSHRTISSPLRSSCMPEEVTVTWHAWHWLRSTSATGGGTRTPRDTPCAAGGSCVHPPSISILRAASSACQASRSRRSAGSSPADRVRVSMRCSVASSTAWPASSPSSSGRSWASSSSTKLALRWSTSAVSCISSVGLRMRPLMSSFSRVRIRVLCPSRSRSESRRRSWMACWVALAVASASSAWA